MITQPTLSAQQHNLLISCLIDFRSFLSQPSEFQKLKALYEKVTFLQELIIEDIEFIKGILSIVLKTYRDHLHTCEKDAGRWPDEVLRHYIDKVVSITDLQKLFI